MKSQKIIDTLGSYDRVAKTISLASLGRLRKVKLRPTPRVPDFDLVCSSHL